MSSVILSFIHTNAPLWIRPKSAGALRPLPTVYNQRRCTGGHCGGIGMIRPQTVHRQGCISSLPVHCSFLLVEFGMRQMQSVFSPAAAAFRLSEPGCRPPFEPPAFDARLHSVIQRVAQQGRQVQVRDRQLLRQGYGKVRGKAGMPHGFRLGRQDGIGSVVFADPPGTAQGRRSVCRRLNIR